MGTLERSLSIVSLISSLPNFFSFTTSWMREPVSQSGFGAAGHDIGCVVLVVVLATLTYSLVGP
jgi:hypothetical protein